ERMLQISGLLAWYRAWEYRKSSRRKVRMRSFRGCSYTVGRGAAEAGVSGVSAAPEFIGLFCVTARGRGSPRTHFLPPATVSVRFRRAADIARAGVPPAEPAPRGCFRS